MLTPVHLRDLLVPPATHPRGQPHLSSASGLVKVGACLYVVADDEHHLGIFEATGDGTWPVELHRLIPEDLPHDKRERKKAKRDFEALALLPASTGQQHRTLLALGSGSRLNRQQAWRVDLAANGRPSGAARAVDLAGLYQPLRSVFPDLNIEGAFVLGGRVRLLQRGNKGDARNACIDYLLDEMLDWLDGRRDPPAASRVTPYELGQLAGVPLGITDGAALPDGSWLFSAVAEDTSDSYNDGRCAGSAIGRVNPDGELVRLETLSGLPKVEGIALDAPARLLMVTDSDDPQIASQLLSVELDA